ncbi:MAG: alpha/beta hydrolase [Alphaproteobacteria bacterium]|nr:alpha/beta hydrolase [Alphaproteobacteria bacterium]
MVWINEADFVFRNHHHERDKIYARLEAESEALRRSQDALLDIPYGPHPRSRFDLFIAPTSKKIVVFIHGGYWQGHSKDRYSCVAAPMVERGYTTAIVGYPLAPEVSINTIKSCVLDALDEICLTMGRHTHRPDRVLLAGHSAGGHLATWASLAWDQNRLPVSAVIPISGIFNLVPIIETSINESLGLIPASAMALSPISYDPPAMPVVAIAGCCETEGFKTQSRDYVDHCNSSDHGSAELVWIDRANHYSILLDFFQTNSKILGKIDEYMDRCR